MSPGEDGEIHVLHGEVAENHTTEDEVAGRCGKGAREVDILLHLGTVRSCDRALGNPFDW